jgi:hypothetical protein
MSVSPFTLCVLAAKTTPEALATFELKTCLARKHYKLLRNRAVFGTIEISQHTRKFSYDWFVILGDSRRMYQSTNIGTKTHCRIGDNPVPRIGKSGMTSS